MEEGTCQKQMQQMSRWFTGGLSKQKTSVIRMGVAAKSRRTARVVCFGEIRRGD
jgi:hypothetical protein